MQPAANCSMPDQQAELRLLGHLAHPCEPHAHDGRGGTFRAASSTENPDARPALCNRIRETLIFKHSARLQAAPGRSPVSGCGAAEPHAVGCSLRHSAEPTVCACNPVTSCDHLCRRRHRRRCRRREHGLSEASSVRCCSCKSPRQMQHHGRTVSVAATAPAGDAGCRNGVGGWLHCCAHPGRSPCTCCPATPVPAVNRLLSQSASIVNWQEFFAANNMKGWDISISVCSWTGVNCSASGAIEVL